MQIFYKAPRGGYGDDDDDDGSGDIATGGNYTAIGIRIAVILLAIGGIFAILELAK